MSLFTPRSRRARTFKPELQELEARANPSVGIGFAGGTLTVTGGGANNNVQITAVGTDYTATIDSQTQTFSGVSKIVLDLKGGADSANLNLSGATLGSLDVQALMGSGNDNLVISLGNLAPGASVNVNADLGPGNDVFQIQGQGVGAGASVTASVLGDLGNDRVAGVFGNLDSSAAVNLDATLARGADLFRLVTGDIGTNASVTAKVDAGHGNDQALFDVGNVSAGGTLNLRTDLAAGSDTFRLHAGTVDPAASASAIVIGGDNTDQAFINVANQANFNLDIRDDVEHITFRNP